MSLKRMLTVTGIVCAVLVVALFSFGPGFAGDLTDDPDPPDGELPKTSSYFCENPDRQHPVGSRLADFFEVEYDDVMAWFCDDGMGFGQIMLALTTAQVDDGEAEAADFLDRRAAGEGWGQIWQSLDLIGRGRPDNSQNDDAEPPEDGGPPENRGRPETTGRHEDVGPGEDRGRHLGWNRSKNKGGP